MESPVKITTVPRFKRFLDKYTKNNSDRKEAVKKSLLLFMSNPLHPGLNVEAIKNSEFWSMRISKSDRIFFRWIEKNKHALLFDVGPHDKYRRY